MTLTRSMPNTEDSLDRDPLAIAISKAEATTNQMNRDISAHGKIMQELVAREMVVRVQLVDAVQELEKILIRIARKA